MTKITGSIPYTEIYMTFKLKRSMKYPPSMAVNKNNSTIGHLIRKKKKIESVNYAYKYDIGANMFRKLQLVFGGRIIYSMNYEAMLLTSLLYTATI